MITLTEETYFSIKYNTEKHWIYALWIGAPDKEAVQNGCNEILAAVQKTGCTIVLSDSRAVTASWTEKAEWCALVWFPKMFATGLEMFAFVQSPHFESRMSAEITKSYMQNEKFSLFDSIEEARCWLNSKEKKEEVHVPITKEITIFSGTIFPTF